MNNKDLEKYIKVCFADNKSFEKGFFQMYKEFSKTEINSFEEFESGPNRFWDFLLDKYDIVTAQYPHISSESLVSRGKTMTRVLEVDSAPIQQDFVDAIKKGTNRRDIHVLDVGPGTIPYSSILLGQEYENVTAMDHEFRLSDECLTKLNVNAVNKFFNKSTRIGKYDLVVGSMPCSAIDRIVYLCAKHNKPYIVKTCSCEMPTREEFYKKWEIDKPLLKRENSSYEDSEGVLRCSGSDWWGWSDLLPELDPNIQSVGDYVFNVENNDGLTKFLKHMNKKLLQKRRKEREERLQTIYASTANKDSGGHIANDEKEID